eukprot:5735315-Amphidinium_carterae.6
MPASRPGGRAAWVHHREFCQVLHLIASAKRWQIGRGLSAKVTLFGVRGCSRVGSASGEGERATGPQAKAAQREAGEEQSGRIACDAIGRGHESFWQEAEPCDQHSGTRMLDQHEADLDQVCWSAAGADPQCGNGPLLHCWHPGAGGPRVANRGRVQPPTTPVHAQGGASLRDHAIATSSTQSGIAARGDFAIHWGGDSGLSSCSDS